MALSTLYPLFVLLHCSSFCWKPAAKWSRWVYPISLWSSQCFLWSWVSSINQLQITPKTLHSYLISLILMWLWSLCFWFIRWEGFGGKFGWRNEGCSVDDRLCWKTQHNCRNRAHFNGRGKQGFFKIHMRYIHVCVVRCLFEILWLVFFVSVFYVGQAFDSCSSNW